MEVIPQKIEFEIGGELQWLAKAAAKELRAKVERRKVNGYN